jgi:hypothetical protein
MRTDGRKDMATLTVALRNIAIAPKNVLVCDIRIVLLNCVIYSAVELCDI